jgi:ATPase family associated with various cellular activities (AAA)
MKENSRKNIENQENELLDLLERVNHELQVNPDLDEDRQEEDFFTRLDQIESLHVLAERLKLNHRQTAILTVLFMCTAQGRGDSGTNMICKQLGCSVIEFMKMRNDVKDLCDRRIVFRERDDYRGHPGYSLPIWVVDKITEGDVSEAGLVNPNSSPLTDLCEAVSHILHERRERFVSAATSYTSLRELEAFFPDIAFVQKAKHLKLNDHELLVYYLVFDNFLNSERDTDIQHTLNQLFNRIEERMRVRKMIAEENSILFSENILELAESNFRSGRIIRFTDSFRSRFLSEFSEEKTVSFFNPKFCIRIEAEKIISKKLYFPEEVERNRLRLSTMIQQGELEKVFSRLTEKGMRKGVTVLLYGFPGTGKTELVNQIAKETGRDIFLVDISSIRDKWVGESEKRLKGIFDEYRKACVVTGKHPILLFNESDALICKRMSVTNSVDQMENAMQNILLQEMENFEGIFIATTNMTVNLDTAFERRFLMKIKFDKPDVRQRALMWQDKISSLAVTEAENLAEQFEFSGGQIENIARRLIMEEVVVGSQPSLDLIIQFWEDELISRGKEKSKIGF